MPGYRGSGRVPGGDARTRRNWNANATAFAARTLGDGLTLATNRTMSLDIDADKGLQFISGQLGIDIPTDGGLKLTTADGLQVDIAGMAANATPAEADSFLFEDSGGSDAKEHATLAELRAAVITPPADGGLKNTTKVFEVDIAGMAAQATPDEADSFLLEDSGGTDAKEHVTLAELRSAIITPPADGGLKNTTSAFEVDISGMVGLADPEDADLLLLEDVSGDGKFKITIGELKTEIGASSDPITFDADAALKTAGTPDLAVDISGMAAQATPDDADMMLVEDSGGSDAKEKITVAQLRVSMGQPEELRTQTGAGTANAVTDKIILCDSSSAFAVTLPANGSALTGVKFYIKNISTGLVSVLVHIDDSPIVDIEGADVTLIEHEAVTVVSNGTRWYII